MAILLNLVKSNDCISPQSAHIAADSPRESGVADHKVSANHNRCRYRCVSKHQMAPWCIYTSAALRGSLGLDRVVTVYVVQSGQ